MILEIILSAGLLVSLAATFIMMRKMSSGDVSRFSEEQIRKYEESTDRLLEETRRQYEARIARLEQRLERQGAELQRTSAMEFEHLANEALDRQAARLAAGNRDGISEILNPLKENLGEFRRAVDDSYVKENSSREALKRQIDSLIKANAEIGSETRRLSDALRGNARMQGRWGEQILERLFDSIGFMRDVHYSIQVTSADGRRLTDDDGKGQRPDLLFFLPGNGRLVIDSKTSLTAYLNYCDATDEEKEKAALKAHVASVRRHVDELARAQYHKYIAGAVEHTLMFMPNDAAYLAAVRADKDLPEYALRRNVVIVSPANMLSILQLVNQLWRIDKQNRNAEEIAELGGKLYDKVAAFLTDFEAVQRSMDSARKAYDKCRRHVAEGNVSIAARADKLRELGVKTSKTIPDVYLSAIDDTPRYSKAE